MTGSPFARTKNHSGSASNTSFCVLLKSKWPTTRIFRACALRTTSPNRSRPGGMERAGIVKGHARRILRDDASHVHETCSRRSLRPRRRAAWGRRSSPSRSGWSGGSGSARASTRIHPRAWRPVRPASRSRSGSSAPLAAITSSPVTVQPRSVSREGRPPA